MSHLSGKVLFWAPRALSIVFIAFLSLFALDVFDGHHGFLETLLALAMHLVPSFVLIGALVLAWRWEWIGSALYAAAGMLHVILITFRPPRNVPLETRLIWMLMIAGPAFVIAALFLANWRKHDQLRSTTPPTRR